MIEPHNVTGLVLHFRTVEATFNCLSALAANGIRRVVLVDNSADRGASLAQLQRRMAVSAQPSAGSVNLVMPELHLICPGENLGFARGVQAGLMAAADLSRGPVLLINSDAMLRPGALTRLCACLPGPAVVVPAILASVPPHPAPTRPPGAPASLLYHYHVPSATYWVHPPAGHAIAYPSGCCLLIAGNQIRADLFDADFFFYGDDVMLGADLARRGLTVAECPEAQVVHPGSLSARNGSFFYEYHMVRAHWLLGHKLARSRSERWRYGALRVITLGARALLRMARTRSMLAGLGFWCASTDALAGRWRSCTPPPARLPDH